MNEFYTEEDARPHSPGLQQIVVPKIPEPPPCDLPKPPRHSSSSESVASPNQRKRPRRRKRPRPSQGDVVLLNYLAPDRPDIAIQAGSRTLCSDSEDQSDTSEEDIDISDENLDRDSGVSQVGGGDADMSSPVQVPTAHTILEPMPKKPDSATALKPGRNAIVATSQVAGHTLNAQVNIPGHFAIKPSISKYHDIDRRNTRSRGRQRRDDEVSRADSNDPNKASSHGIIDPTHSRALLEQPHPFINDPHNLEPNGTNSIATSPKLQPHLIPPASRSPRQMLPAIQPESPITQDAQGSPDQQLPSVVRRLLKNIAPEDDAVSSNARPRSTAMASPGNAPALSPTLLGKPFPLSPRRSSRASTRNTPSSGFSDQSPSHHFSILSPTASSTSLVEPDSVFRILRVPSEPCRFPPSLKTNSSSNTSNPSNGSSSEGLTPNSMPTPGDQTAPTTERSIRRLSHGRGGLADHFAPIQTGIFRCNFDGCTASPFQTQYLLNSHLNVHSEKRPHYCPFSGCPHAEGGPGKGFKRKNERNRHQLVHKSPIYICPFCPDRDHRYPRRDNLQRHIKRHHEDKDIHDPLLREVLNQRTAAAAPSFGTKKRTHQS